MMLQHILKQIIKEDLDFNQWDKSTQYELIRAVIKAIREPSGDMMTQAYHAVHHVWSYQGIEDCWKAMVDEILMPKDA